MPDGTESPAIRRWPHILRLAVFVALLLTMFYLVAIARVVNVDQVRDAVAATGPVAGALDLSEGEPVFTVERTTWWQGQAITHVRLTHGRGHRMTTRY